MVVGYEDNGKMGVACYKKLDYEWRCNVYDFQRSSGEMGLCCLLSVAKGGGKCGGGVCQILRRRKHWWC